MVGMAIFGQEQHGERGQRQANRNRRQGEAEIAPVEVGNGADQRLEHERADDMSSQRRMIHAPAVNDDLYRSMDAGITAFRAS